MYGEDRKGLDLICYWLCTQYIDLHILLGLRNVYLKLNWKFLILKCLPYHSHTTLNIDHVEYLLKLKLWITNLILKWNCTESPLTLSQIALDPKVLAHLLKFHDPEKICIESHFLHLKYWDNSTLITVLLERLN